MFSMDCCHVAGCRIVFCVANASPAVFCVAVAFAADWCLLSAACCLLPAGWCMASLVSAGEELLEAGTRHALAVVAGVVADGAAVVGHEGILGDSKRLQALVLLGLQGGNLFA